MSIIDMAGISHNGLIKILAFRHKEVIVREGDSLITSRPLNFGHHLLKTV